MLNEAREWNELFVLQTTQEVYEETTTSTTSSNYRKETRTTRKFHGLQLNNLPTRHKNSADVDAFVKMPSGGIDRPVIVDNQDGTISIRYDPREEGCHELHVKFNGEHIQGSPFKFNVDSISSGYVTAYGPGLVHGVANEPTQFHISTKGAASGGLNVAVEGPSKADINYHDNRDGTVTVTYLPAAPGDYKITIKFANEHIKGSPYTAKITGEGRKRAQISVGHSSEVSLKVQEKDVKTLNAYIVAPNGLEEPCFLKQLPNGQLGISFTPRLTGEHRIHVRRQGQEITGSPFKISVLDCEIGDSTRVQTSGPGLTQGITQATNEFTINTKDAGYGGLSISMEGPSKADIKVKDNEDGTVKVNYVPSEPGYYILNIKFADHHVRGSPFTVKVDGEGSNVQRERIKKQREAAPVSDVGQECKLIFKLPNACAIDMDAKVQGPGGDSNPATIRDAEDGAYEVSFVPKVAGVHHVTVRHKKFHIPGSPFQFTVGPLRDYGAHRVHAGGQGLERGVANDPCEFNIWTREAGAGALAVSVEGPSKAAIDFKDRKDGSCYISYKVADPGEYRVGIKFNDQHIPDSPFKVYVMPPVGDAAKIELANVPENIKVNTPANLTLRMNGAKGTLDGEVVDPSNRKDDAFMCCLDAEEWALRFVPKENGVHHIHIRCDGVHIPQSPFRVLVGTDDADPAAVNAHGPGLREAVAGLKTDFIVDTTAAGIGKLKVQVDGPTKVSMDCTEVDEGYKVHYTPLAPGDYFIAVKYNGYQISGSPFKVTVSGEAARTSAGGLVAANVDETANVELDTVRKVGTTKADRLPAFKSDATRCTSKGLGLKKAVMGRANSFTVDCSNAGNNMLYCSVFGPKGPCDETFVKHMGRNMYNVTYQCKERGDHIIIVKWGDENIPGSPFKVISA
ncbi:filamin-C-like [Tropilaelaps mercedesae]|uniref:Filamin-C-like n=1 Tax=Tropilaelaps mercedesae TaxID=418985 RepID=A0A1V9Y337_9ACAR|nr:filamin-C-like [Tropilaelaps mercedesae]